MVKTKTTIANFTEKYELKDMGGQAEKITCVISCHNDNIFKKAGKKLSLPVIFSQKFAIKVQITLPAKITEI